MKKLFTIIAALVFINAKAQTPTPFTSKITNSTGLYTQTSATICPTSAGSATITGTTGWPFGVGYEAVTDLHIALNHTITIPNGAIADYNSITIDSGGVLQITGGPYWTYIGCKGAIILNGTIVGKGSPSGIYQTHFPDYSGDTTGTVITYTIVQDSAGNGGGSGNSFSQWSYGNQPQYSYGALGGSQYDGNGGGGGSGDGLQYQGDCGCWTPYQASAAIGGNATDSTSGGGSSGGGALATLPVSIYSQNGNNSANCLYGSSWAAPTAGGSGGTRGMHGNLIFIQAMSGISGNGIIDVSGNGGGNGGNSGQCVAGPDGPTREYSSSGGGGGGGAGGSGGYVYINYVGTTLSSAQVLVAGGTGGAGGSAGTNSAGGNNGQGQSGFAGDNGTTGVYTSNSINSYTFQWYQNTFTQLSGAILSTYTATAAGVYDCYIKDLSGISHWTSGTTRNNKDTVISDGTPIAVITHAPSSICSGDTAALTVSYVSGQSYQWYWNNSPIGSATTDTIFKITQGGVYLVAALNTCNNITGVPSNTVNITLLPLPPTPTVTAIGDTIFCQGGSVVLKSSSNTNNTWSNSVTTQTISVNQDGSYQVTVTSNSCSATSATTSVTVLPASINAGHDTTLACGYNLQLNAVAAPTPTLVTWLPISYLSNSNTLTPICTPTTTVTYTVTANFGNGCSANDTITITSNAVNPFICMVTTDSTSGYNYNIVSWDKTTPSNIDSFIIYREVSTNVYKRIGAVSNDSLSEFKDTARSIGPNNGDPNTGAYRYKLQIKDTCHNYSAMSPYHNTVRIINAGSGSFTWNIYAVENLTVTPVTNFNLMRDDNNTDNFQLISGGSVSGTQISLTDPNYASYPNANWRVDALGFNCTPTYRLSGNNSTDATRVKSHSNTQRQAASGINQITSISGQVLVYPNPNNGMFNIKLNNYDNTSIEVYNLIGEKILTITLQNNTTQLDLSTYANGMYQLRIVKNNTSVYQTKISKVD